MFFALLVLLAALISAATTAAVWYARNRPSQEGFDPRGRTERMIADVLVSPSDPGELSGPGSSACASH